jgi:hypothetical protein
MHMSVCGNEYTVQLLMDSLQPGRVLVSSTATELSVVKARYAALKCGSDDASMQAVGDSGNLVGVGGGEGVSPGGANTDDQSGGASACMTACETAAANADALQAGTGTPVFDLCTPTCARHNARLRARKSTECDNLAVDLADLQADVARDSASSGSVRSDATPTSRRPPAGEKLMDPLSFKKIASGNVNKDYDVIVVSSGENNGKMEYVAGKGLLVSEYGGNGGESGFEDGTVEIYVVPKIANPTRCLDGFLLYGACCTYSNTHVHRK